jgi:O-Antigen ligase
MQLAFESDALSLRRRSWAPPRIAVSAALVAGGVVAVDLLLPNWNFGLMIAAVTIAVFLPLTLRATMPQRLALFFALIALDDFLKRVTFLADGQSAWSQYSVYALPYIYYCGFILPAWFRSIRFDGARPVLKWIAAFCIVALASTWLAPGFPISARIAASGLLIMPITMIAVAASYPDALAPVAGTLAGLAVLSALYAFWQMLFGFTPIERAWMAGAGSLSLGAQELGQDAVLVSRVCGLQPDAFTFGLLEIAGLFSAWVLNRSGRLGGAAFAAIAMILSAGIAACLVRTIWFAFIAGIAFAMLVSKQRWLMKPAVFVLLLGVLFLAADPALSYMHSLTSLGGDLSNPYVERALTVGTLAARLGALAQFARLLPSHWLIGSGYAAHPFIALKFGGAALINSDSHNAVVGLLLYTGLPGLVLMGAILGVVARGALKKLNRRASRSIAAAMAGCVFAMLVAGFGNGGAFLGYYFFFFSGVLAAEWAEPAGTEEC